MDKIKVVSLTHEEDMDGIGAQAIIYRFFKTSNISAKKYDILSDLFGRNIKEDIDLVCLRTNYTDYIMQWAAIFAKNIDKISKSIIDKLKLKSKKFEDIFESFYNYLSKSKISNFLLKQQIFENQSDYVNIQLIIITDLGFNENFESVLNVLENSKFIIAYFDHHEHPANIRDRYKKICVAYINDGIQTASEIASNYFLSGDDIAFNIAKFGADADFNKFKLPETEKFQSILNRKLTDEVFDAMMGFFAAGNFKQPLIEKLYQESVMWQNEQEEFLKTHTYSIIKKTKDNVDINFIIGISKLKGERMTRIFQKIYTPKAEDVENVFVFIAIDAISREVNIRSHKINVLNIAKKYGGGGHSERAGFILLEKYNKNPQSLEMDSSMIDYEQLTSDILKIIEKSN
jgi:oligoribonuclease NrnB/cAMP/cGMP phosphodiesterase (DHH superfamily)